MLSKRYKRRNRHPRKQCKKLRELWNLMELFYDSSFCEQCNVDDIKKRLKPLTFYLKKRYELVLTKRDPDYRSGSETYGYDSEEDILYTLHYISDRWNCSFRVRWLINLVEPDYTYGLENS